MTIKQQEIQDFLTKNNINEFTALEVEKHMDIFGGYNYSEMSERMFQIAISESVKALQKNEFDCVAFVRSKLN